MSRWLKALPLALALAALSIFGGSCGSGSPAQIRFVHAIQDSNAMDIEVNGTAEFTNLSFLGVQPNQPGYTSVPSGGDTIQGFVTGTTTKVFTDTATLGASVRYTLVATGFSKTGNNGSNVDLLQISDNIPTPQAGEVAFRVVHASPSGPVGPKGVGIPGPVDVYILLNPSTGPIGSPTISSLAYTQASLYVSIPNNPNDDTVPPGFTVYVTAAGTTQTVCSGPINPQAGADRTLVLTDVQNGNQMNSTFLELSDLN